MGRSFHNISTSPGGGGYKPNVVSNFQTTPVRYAAAYRVFLPLLDTSITINPTSKVRIDYMIGGETSNYEQGFMLYRKVDNESRTSIGQLDTSNNGTREIKNFQLMPGYDTDASSTPDHYTGIYIDTPGGSKVTYMFAAVTSSSVSHSFALNCSIHQNLNTYYENVASCIILTEIET